MAEALDRKLRIFVAGHRGMVGTAIIRFLESKGFTHLISRTRSELDLRDQAAVNAFFKAEKPQVVLMAAGKVGGIQANSREPADFMFDNLAMAMNVIHAAAENETEKLVYFGSSCVYPNGAAQPFRENSLLTGPIEVTNEGYGLAKIGGIKLCQFYHRQYGRNFTSVIPANLYGPFDHFDPARAHVIPSLMRRLHEAKQAGRQKVEVWGTGRSIREFLFIDDLPRALVPILEGATGPGPINVGLGTQITIGDLAREVAAVVGFKGDVVFDTTKPDGAPIRTLESSTIAELGWRPKVPLTEGLQRTYRWALESRIL